MKGRILSINVSERKRVPKRPVEEGFLEEDRGLVGDAHAGPGERQVSLLAWESIEKFKVQSLKLKVKGLKLKDKREECPKVKSEEAELKPGGLAENITTEGINLTCLPLGTKLRIGNETILQISKIGKDCHVRCAIYQRMGDCPMPREGIFAKVVKGGPIRVKDEIEALK